MASLGAPDPRLDSQGNFHYILQQQLRGYTRADPPPSRVKPIPFTLIHHAFSTAMSPLDQATADMAILGFFFLLRPSEHTAASPQSDSSPFRLCDVTFCIGASVVEAATGPLDTIPLATFATLRFTRQKNGTTNELIGHARSGHATTCPVLALIRRTLHLRSFNAPPNTPLCTFYATETDTTPITSLYLTTLLRRSATALLSTLGFPPTEISARAIRAGGAMALLCARVDADVIKLVGRWRSDQMLRYLHLQAYPQMHTFATLMVQHGSFHLLHNQPLPPEATALLASTPL